MTVSSALNITLSLDLSSSLEGTISLSLLQVSQKTHPCP